MHRGLPYAGKPHLHTRHLAQRLLESLPGSRRHSQVRVYSDMAGQRTGIGTPTLCEVQPTGTRKGPCWELAGTLCSLTCCPSSLTRPRSQELQGLSLSFSSLSLTYKMATRSIPKKRSRRKTVGARPGVCLIPRTGSEQVMCGLVPGVCTLEDRREGRETLLRWGGQRGAGTVPSEPAEWTGPPGSVGGKGGWS